MGVAGCGGPGLPEGAPKKLDVDETPHYLIGPGDSVNIFVWRNEELSVTVPVRPDGRITTPLVEDVVASGRTPTQLARVMENELSTYIKEPEVTVMVDQFQGLPPRQIRVVGEATEPMALPYQDDLSLLDVMIEVGGLTEFAAGNRAKLVRTVDGERKQYNVRLDDLVRDGDISQNVDMLPGDVLFIPEALF
ncbi:MAG: XrtA/PEP-CTERM system exopolysaccharide export protein [Thiohalorhabdus sp.]|uniref:XrtA/PEP-CTERM system exopolysaccharide export protein n=1 Tax=Thiohalorhabdus sp. TaxID=3094134 RepID=UPI00397EAFF3